MPERELRERARLVDGQLRALGRPHGAPWGADERLATLVAWMALG